MFIDNIYRLLLILALAIPSSVWAHGDYDHNPPPQQPTDSSSSSDNKTNIWPYIGWGIVLYCGAGKVFADHWCFVKHDETGFHFTGKQQPPVLDSEITIERVK